MQQGKVTDKKELITIPERRFRDRAEQCSGTAEQTTPAHLPLQLQVTHCVGLSDNGFSRNSETRSLGLSVTVSV